MGKFMNQIFVQILTGKKSSAEFFNLLRRGLIVGGALEVRKPSSHRATGGNTKHYNSFGQSSWGENIAKSLGMENNFVENFVHCLLIGNRCKMMKLYGSNPKKM